MDFKLRLIFSYEIDTIPDCQKLSTFVFDEVKIKEDLVYDKHSGEVVGFVNVGDVNNQLKESACLSRVINLH